MLGAVLPEYPIARSSLKKLLLGLLLAKKLLLGLLLAPGAVSEPESEFSICLREPDLLGAVLGGTRFQNREPDLLGAVLGAVRLQNILLHQR